MEQSTNPQIDQESICRRCGRCCHRKEISHGKLVISKEECPNLEKDERGRASCKIYSDRVGKVIVIGDKAVRCILTEEAYTQGLLPADCPYVYFYQHGMDKKLRNFLKFQEACETQDWNEISPEPKKNCKHCYGRGYDGRNVNTNTYVPCTCLS